MAACYVCGGYLYRGVRHAKCEPRYRRSRIKACSVCGGMSRGEKHRLCGTQPVGYRACGYCGATTRGAYHKECSPLKAEFSVFGDLPDVVQRRCSGCQEWFPFAGPDIDASEAWSPHGRSTSYRLLYDSRCRACLAEQRRGIRVRPPLRTTKERRDALVAALQTDEPRVQIAKRLGLSAKTVYRYQQKAKAA